MYSKIGDKIKKYIEDMLLDLQTDVIYTIGLSQNDQMSSSIPECYRSLEHTPIHSNLLLRCDPGRQQNGERIRSWLCSLTRTESMEYPYINWNSILFFDDIDSNCQTPSPCTEKNFNCSNWQSPLPGTEKYVDDLNSQPPSPYTHKYVNDSNSQPPSPYTHKYVNEFDSQPPSPYTNEYVNDDSNSQPPSPPPCPGCSQINTIICSPEVDVEWKSLSPSIKSDGSETNLKRPVSDPNDETFVKIPMLHESSSTDLKQLFVSSTESMSSGRARHNIPDDRHSTSSAYVFRSPGQKAVEYSFDSRRPSYLDLPLPRAHMCYEEKYSYVTPVNRRQSADNDTYVRSDTCCDLIPKKCEARCKDVDSYCSSSGIVFMRPKSTLNEATQKRCLRLSAEINVDLPCLMKHEYWKETKFDLRFSDETYKRYEYFFSSHDLYQSHFVRRRSLTFH